MKPDVCFSVTFDMRKLLGVVFIFYHVQLIYNQPSDIRAIPYVIEAVLEECVICIDTELIRMLAP